MLYEFLAKNRIGNRTVTSCQILRIVLEYLQYVLLLKESSSLKHYNLSTIPKKSAEKQAVKIAAFEKY